MGLQINVITRDEWGARKPKEDNPAFKIPGKNVILTLKTDFGECKTKEECIQRCQSIQEQHMDQWGLSDIAYNFLIGDDGNIYEGRGWDFKPQKAINNPDHHTQSYDIGLIGDYREVVPNSIHYQLASWEDHAQQFKRLDTAYLVYPWVDTKASYNPAVIKLKHEEFRKEFPDIARVYDNPPNIRFDFEEIMKQMKGKKVKETWPYIPIV